jgi:phospholipid-transporting ATPase
MNNNKKDFDYLELLVPLHYGFGRLDENVLFLILINFCKWFLVLMNFVAISLLVCLELTKFTQGIFIEKDWMIYDEEKDLPAKVQSSNLNEELGMVSYIFSDKTGTLT